MNDLTNDNDLTIDLGHTHYHVQTWGCTQCPPLILLHGFMGSSRDFEAVTLRLCQRFYCVAIDLPGHGATTVLGDETCYRMAAIALGLTQVLDALALSDCHLLGYSMGGRVALYWAIYYPHLFQSVIIESGSPGLATESERRDRRQQDDAIAQRLERENFDRFLDGWYSLPLFQSLRQHSTYPNMLDRRRQNNPLELARSLRQLGTGRQPSLWPSLSTLVLPCLWMVGEADSKFVKIGHQVTAINPNITMQIVSHCGHSVHQESPAQHHRFVQTFIEKSQGQKKSAL